MNRMVGCDWIDLARNSDKWYAILNMEVDFRVSLNAGSFLTG